MVDLIVFLGNPGRQYRRNRHNVGWLFAEALPFYPALSWQKKYRGLYAQGDTAALEAPEARRDPVSAAGGAPVPSRKVHFLKPGTFMNLSGEAAAAAAAFFKIDAPSILVIHDELELSLGTVSLKLGGGLGGHNGLRSMKASLGTAEFWRLRFGIGRPDDRAPGQGGPPGSGKGIMEWVLSDFSAAEQTVLDRVFTAAAPVLTGALIRGPEPLLPEWGKKRVPGEL